MDSYRARFVASLVLLMVTAGCGTGNNNSFNPNNVTVTVSPPTVTIPTNGQVILQATVTGLCSACIASFQSWSITENPSGADCATYVGITPPGPCPAGTLQIPNGDALTVTYFAPNTPGTLHVNAEWEDFVNFTGPPVATKVGTSVVTLSP